MKSTAVGGTGPEVPQRLPVFRSRVTFVPGEVVMGPPAVHLPHDAIPRHLRDHGGGTDGNAPPVPPDQRSLKRWKGDAVPAVNQQAVRRLAKCQNRPPHRFERSVENVDPVDLRGLDDTDSPVQGSLRDAGVERLPNVLGKAFGIVDAVDGKHGIQNDSGRNHRTCQGSSSRFVDTRDTGEAPARV